MVSCGFANVNIVCLVEFLVRPQSDNHASTAAADGPGAVDTEAQEAALSKAKFPFTDELTSVLPQALEKAGLKGIRILVNADPDSDFDDSTDDEISFTDEAGRKLPLHIQSGPHGLSVNWEYYDAEGELESIKFGSSHSPSAFRKVAAEAAKAIAEEKSEPANSPAPKL